MKNHTKNTKIFLFTTLHMYSTKINNVNSLYLLLNKINGYFEEINRNNYLTLVPTDESKEKIEKYKELWIKIRDLIRLVTKKADDYDEKFIKIKLHSDDKLSLNKTIESPGKVIVVRAFFFFENNKYYPQVFLGKCLYKI